MATTSKLNIDKARGVFRPWTEPWRRLPLPFATESPHATKPRSGVRLPRDSHRRQARSAPPGLPTRCQKRRPCSIPPWSGLSNSATRRLSACATPSSKPLAQSPAAGSTALRAALNSAHPRLLQPPGRHSLVGPSPQPWQLRRRPSCPAAHGPAAGVTRAFGAPSSRPSTSSSRPWS